MSVDEVEGSFKLNQHKSDADYAGAADALARQPEAAARMVAGEMRALRPQLFASGTTQSNARTIQQGTT
jgi:transcriptional regulator